MNILEKVMKWIRSKSERTSQEWGELLQSLANERVLLQNEDAVLKASQSELVITGIDGKKRTENRSAIADIEERLVEMDKLEPQLQNRLAEARQREAVEARAARIKAVEDEVVAATATMLAAFGGDALGRQIEALEVAWKAINEVMVARYQLKKGGDGFTVEIPPALQTAMMITLHDPATERVVWHFKQGNVRAQGGKSKAA